MGIWKGLGGRWKAQGLRLVASGMRPHHKCSKFLGFRVQRLGETRNPEKALKVCGGPLFLTVMSVLYLSPMKAIYWLL